MSFLRYHDFGGHLKRTEAEVNFYGSHYHCEDLCGSCFVQWHWLYEISNIVLSVHFVNNAGSVCCKMCFIYLTWQEMLNAKVHKKAFFCIHVKRKELTEQGILAGIYVEADPVSWEVADGFLLSPIFYEKSESGTRGK